jgi:hypothetical protein
MAQRWLRDLTGKRLLAHLELHPQLQAAAEDVLAFARVYPSIRPYARPIHWAPYVMVGA